MNDREKSDGAVVPKKPPNKAERLAAEVVEGRAPAKGNTDEQNASRTQRRTDTPSALDRVHQAARGDRKQRFTALLHHVYRVEHLRTTYYAMKRGAAAGIDGETWHSYGQDLEANLADLSGRVMRGAHPARPVGRV